MIDFKCQLMRLISNNDHTCEFLDDIDIAADLKISFHNLNIDAEECLFYLL